MVMNNHKVVSGDSFEKDIAESSLHPTCLVCGGVYGSSKLSGLLQCQSCGFISADLKISDEELQAIYGQDYFHGNEYLDYIAEQESLKINFRDRIQVLQRVIPDFDKKNLLEIGCAYGFFLEEVSKGVHSASGVDISAEAVDYAVSVKKLSAYCGSYLEMNFDKSFDVITLWDTIEHLKQPDRFIEKAANDLEPHGYLAITTGDIGSFNARLRGTKWRMIHPPTHLHYFSISTLSQLLERYGFEVIHISHPGNSRNVRSMLYMILALRLKQRKLYQAIQGWRLFNLRLTLNLYDIMYVIARRKEAIIQW